MTAAELEAILRELPTRGTLVKDRGYRQIWRFEAGGRPYYLKFYPRGGSRDAARRLFRGSPAMNEFRRLQLLQKAAIPAPRAISMLSGFGLNGQVGDAVILAGIEPSVALDAHLNKHKLAGEPVPDHLALATQVRELIAKLGAAGLGHEDLHLGNFLLSNGTVYLLDGYAVRPGGLAREHVLQLGHSAAPFATRTDLLRGWRRLRKDEPMPGLNPVSRRFWNRSISRVTGENRYFGTLESAGFRGAFYKQAGVPRRWSVASRIEATARDWEQLWPDLWRRIEADAFEVLKRSPSGDVLAGEVVLAGRPLPVIVKRPRRRYWYRYVNEIGRGSRARRAWFKAWRVIFRDMPTAWPVVLMERRTLGYVTDAVVVFERVPGPTLSKIDLGALAPRDRDMLFRRVGRVLRRIESFGWSHFDAKASNWIVYTPPGGAGGPVPVMIDIDGIRRRRWVALGIERLLRSMRSHPQYTPADSLALCQGYAPWSPVRRDEGNDEDGGWLRFGVS